MASFPTDDEIHDFWSWFESVAAQLGEDFDNVPLLEGLERRVSRLGDLAWELGPGSHAESALTITPDGAPEWLPVSQRIVALAPTIVGWEFHPARRAKDWDLQFSIEGKGGQSVDVDARPWRYVLFRRPEGRFDIVLEQNNLVEVDDDDRYPVAVVLLDGLLGEAKRLLLLDDIEPVVALPPNQALKANCVAVLTRHLGSLE